MRITAIETFVVNTGFKPPRPWHFCAVRTDEGLTGYSEFGSEGITRGLVGLVQDFGARLIGKDPTAVERHYLDMYRAVRQASYGATQQAMAGIELALWDLAGKSLGVPVWRLMGGPHRERQRVYWSHCATYRVENWELFRVKPLRTMADVADCAREAAAKGYTALKTNIIWPGDPARRITQGRTGPHDQLATRDIIDQAVAQIGAMREAVGPKVDICLDVNVNFKPSEALLLARELEPFKLFWMEIDSQAPRRWSSSARGRARRCAGASSSRPCGSTGHTSSATRWTPSWWTSAGRGSRRPRRWRTSRRPTRSTWRRTTTTATSRASRR
jgi:L-alanine-DL-glutamate epimerase-like enolase superfamily enzyme